MDTKLAVGDIIEFKFDALNGGLQRRIIGLVSGKYYSFDIDLMCACHVADTLEDMTAKYAQFSEFKIIKRKKREEVKSYV